MASLGEAFINVRADLKPFTKDLAKELRIILNAAEKEVSKRGKVIGKNLSDSIASGAKANASKIGDVIGKEVKKKKITIQTEVDKDRAVASARRAFDGVESLAKGASTSIAKRFADTFTSLGRAIGGVFQRAFSGLGGGGGGGGGKGGGIAGAAFAGAIGLLISLIAALIPLAVQAAQAVGGLVAAIALIPAAGAAVAASVGILTLAFQGFDKAISAALEGNMDAFNKALEKLSPSARRVARAVQPFLTMIQKAVQEGFFSRIVGGVEKFFAALSKSGVGGQVERISTLFGSIVDDFFRWLSTKEGLGVIRSVLKSIADSLVILRPALRPLTQAFGILIKAGASVLPTVAKVIAELAQHFADFIKQAEKSGALKTFFDNLSKVFVNLGPVIEQAFGLLVQFLNWAVKNPDAITGIANAFFGLANALSEAFKDPQVVASLGSIVEILNSISPEQWAALTTSILQLALALGILGAALIWLATKAAEFKEKWNKFIGDLFFGVDDAPRKIKGGAVKWKEAGKALMGAFFDGLKSMAGNVGNVAGAIISRIKSALNAAIGSINRGLASAFSVFHVNPPDIPFLAKGAIVTGPTLAMVGEAGPEAVIPLNNPGRATALLMQSGLANMMAPVVNVFLGTEQLEQRMYQVVTKNNVGQARNLLHGPRTA